MENQNKEQKKMNPVLKIILIIATSLFSLFFLLVLAAYISLPDISEMVERYEHSQPTVMYDINGEVIESVEKENRDVVKIDKIPKELQMAFVTVEDKRFYSHHGFDLKRTGKAMFVNIIKMRKAQGGSTITQQLARNAFLSMEKTITRKIKEAIITMELEKKYSKDEILEKYLNEIYFGEGAYGVQTASKIFFNKNVEDLTLAECAMLAGIPNRPKKYSPLNHFENAKERQELILKLMANNGVISEKEYERAVDYKIRITQKKIKKKQGVKAPEFTDAVIKELIDKYGEQAVYENGMKVYTTLDLRMQKEAVSAFQSSIYMKKMPDLQGALISIDSETGYVKAMVGGKDFVAGNFNRALYGKRQPGSSFKPFVYFTAIQKGMAMNKMIENTPLTIGTWSPKNYDRSFSAGITMAEALEKSKNIPTIRILQSVGIDPVVKNCRAAGFKSSIPADYTIGLGSMSITPIEITTAYAAFSNGGYRIDPVFITKIEDKDGNVIFEAEPKQEKIFEPEDVALIVKMMENAATYGSGYASNIGIYQAGKTGTTSDYTDAWFIGFTPNLVTSIYYGFDNNKPMKSGMTGGDVAAPVWGKYMLKLVGKKIYKPVRFKFRDQLVSKGKLFYSAIDLDTGKAATLESKRIRTLLFKPGKEAPAIANEAEIKAAIAATMTTEQAIDSEADSAVEDSEAVPAENGSETQKKETEKAVEEVIGDSILD